MAWINKPKKKKIDYALKRKDRMKIYNSQRWRDLREWKFTHNPLCEMCEREERITPADDVHHIVSFMSTDDPVKRNWLAYDFDNLMSLCDRCHQKMHNNGKSVQ